MTTFIIFGLGQITTQTVKQTTCCRVLLYYLTENYHFTIRLARMEKKKTFAITTKQLM